LPEVSRSQPVFLAAKALAPAAVALRLLSEFKMIHYPHSFTLVAAMFHNHAIAGFLSILFLISQTAKQGGKPEWCRKLPRPEYGKLQRVDQPDKWFEVYRTRPGVFALFNGFSFLLRQ